MEPDERAEYVERWARVLEGQGNSRISGRIYAHLATADEPYLSLQQLADQLGVSRASISTNTRRLIAQGMLERVAVPGSRGEHYGLARDSRALVAGVAALTRQLQELSLEGLQLQKGKVTPGTQHLRALSEVYGQLAETLEAFSTPVRKAAR